MQRFFYNRIAEQIGGGAQTRLTIDRPALEGINSAIVPRGVVDVFPIRSYWD